MARPAASANLALPGLEDTGLSPIHRQYLDLKRQHPDALLLFRLGDFYETFAEDASAAARILDIALTSREMGRGERLPMAGIPAQSADGYVARLVASGQHVAIAEQIGEATRTGIVPRRVVRVVTPGTVVETELLAGNRNNFLAAVVHEGGRFGLAYVDISTGELAATEVDGSGAHEHVAAELTRLGPAECLLPEAWDVDDVLPSGSHTTPRPAALFAHASAARALARRFGGPDGSTDLDQRSLAVRAAGALLGYLVETRPAAVETLAYPRLYAMGAAMQLDSATRLNLEIDSPTAGPTLLSVLDRTATGMGGRLLRGWLGQPLLDAGRVNERLDLVAWLYADAALRRHVAAGLQRMPDIERLGVRAGQQLLAPRECLALASGIERVPALRTLIESTGELPLLAARCAEALDGVPELVQLVSGTLREDATVFEQGVIRPGVSAELDEQRSLAGDARRWIAELEQRERERSGVRSIKVGFNKVFGYYFEVSVAQCSQPSDYYQRQATGAATIGDHLERLGWTRKQTLSHAERFVTPELRDLESRVASARDESLRLERELYNRLLAALAELAPRVSSTARAVALLDVGLSLAVVADQGRYVRPVVDEGNALSVQAGRHPVVEHAQPPGAFVPNDLRLSPDARIALLTGPNMAGKSTFLRQVALIVLMAQVGSFVPADEAHVGIVDRIFTRIGAHDDLAAGRSTFMVEMVEVATILRSASERSLVVLDEVGRGTSTFDGLAMAQAIVEDLHDEERPRGAPKVVFATHYHELTALADTLPAMRNYRVDVLEEGDDVVFLHTVVPGGADRSYGIHVASLAGVPARVTRRARALLRDLEGGPPIERGGVAPDTAVACDVCGQLAAVDVLAISPLQAQAELVRLQQLLEPR